ncbi:MAG: hypothetical protein M0D57_10790 [Sphingobacteriales bacterium JAD_PAG50586_3]|nr:MAG: hypothetical protein M0D57_10790 [Sphingobacteriales bacterium JAD_PAG50586_3]
MKIVLLGLALFITLTSIAQGTLPPRKNDVVVYSGHYGGRQYYPKPAF